MSDRENDEYNVVLNYFDLIELTNSVSFEFINEEESEKEYLESLLSTFLYLMIAASAVFAIGIIPLQACIVKSTEQITLLFSTLSPSLLASMHN